MIQIINGGSTTDDRGTVRYVNDFTFDNVRRFYTVTNKNKDYIRDWHGHYKETIYAHVVSGSVLMGLINLKNNEAYKYLLEGAEPKILIIPPGYASSFQSLTDCAIVIYFSTASLEESETDSYRYPAEQWDIFDL